MIVTTRVAAERRRLSSLFAGMVLVALAVNGCSGTGLESHDAVSAQAAKPSLVYLMPILDRRTIERSRSVLATKQVENATSSILGEKGYQVEIAEVSDEEQLRMLVDSRDVELSVESLISAAPASAETLLVVYLDLIDTEFNSPTVDFRVKVSAVLIDTATRAAVWRNSGEASANGTGVFAVVSPSAAQYEAIYRGLTDLFTPLTADSLAS